VLQSFTVEYQTLWRSVQASQVATAVFWAYIITIHSRRTNLCSWCSLVAQCADLLINYSFNHKRHSSRKQVHAQLEFNSCDRLRHAWWPVAKHGGASISLYEVATDLIISETEQDTWELKKNWYDCVPCARYFSFEANIYARGFLDMRVLPFSYPHPFLPPSLPWAALRNSRPLLCRTSSENLHWKFCLVFLPNSVSKSGGVACYCGPPTWRPRGSVSLSSLVLFAGGCTRLGRGRHVEIY
jgi:hypothetical protein